MCYLEYTFPVSVAWPRDICYNYVMYIVCGVLLFEIFADWHKLLHAQTNVLLHSKNEIITTLLWLSQLQLNDIMSLLHCVFMSPILLRVKACVECVGCLQSNML